jgi:pyruvate,water dikinase
VSTWSGVWTWQAFEERLFWKVDHRAVKMGVAVTPAFTQELASGVLVTTNIDFAALDGYYVNVQKREASVTNPTDGSIPEVFLAAATASGITVLRKNYSSLSLNAALLTNAQIDQLVALASRINERFATLYKKNPWDAVFEIEFKLDDPEPSIYIKQVRPWAAPIR